MSFLRESLTYRPLRTSAVTLTEAYFSLAEYTGTECKYSEPFGTDLTLTLGGGEQSFTFTRSAKVRERGRAVSAVLLCLLACLPRVLLPCCICSCAAHLTHAQLFTSPQGINIVPTVIQLNGRGRFAVFTDPNAAASPSLGNGFFANNFGWSFNGING
jgi:hypothetical protein